MTNTNKDWRESFKTLLYDCIFNEKNTDCLFEFIEKVEQEAIQRTKNEYKKINNSGKTLYQMGYKDGLNEKDTSCDAAFKLLKGKASHDPVDRIMDRMGESDVY